MEGRRLKGEGTIRNVPRPVAGPLQANPQRQAPRSGQRRLRSDSHPEDVQENLL